MAAGDSHVILNLRVVSARSTANPIVTKVKIKTDPSTKVVTLRKALAKEARRPSEFLKLTYSNQTLLDGQTLAQHGMMGSVNVEVILFDNQEELNRYKQQEEEQHNSACNSRGTKRQNRDDDEMESVSSKRTKLTHEENEPMTNSNEQDRNACMMSVVGDEEETHIQDSKISAFPWEIQQQQNQRRARQTPYVWKQKCGVYSSTLQGGKAKNEDNIYQFQSPSGAISCVAIFDGHGLSSFAVIASKVAAKISDVWFDQFHKEMVSWTEKQWRIGFTRLFEKIHSVMRTQFEKLEKRKRIDAEDPLTNIIDEKGIVRHSDNKAVHGGTTASFAVLIRNEKGQSFVTAHVGDSEIILVKESSPQNPGYEIITTGHRVLNAAEYKRVQDLPDEHYPIKLQFVYHIHAIRNPSLLPKVFYPDGRINTKITSNPANFGLYPSNIRQEPATYAITPENVADRVRLANTKSLGDFYAHQFGLSHEPEVQMESLPTDSDYFLVAASDGVWDTWTYEDVVSCLLQWMDGPQHTFQQKLEAFLRETKQRGCKLFLLVDDCSMGFIHIPKHPPSTQR